MELQTVILCVGLFLLFYLKLISSEVKKSERFKDKAFENEMKIYDEIVTCMEDPIPGRFPAHTWTCKDMRVSGRRMAYGYNPSISKEHKCTETKGFDELAEVCRKMMHGIGAFKKLWVAFVTNATCDYINEERVMLNMTKEGGFRWDGMKAGYGWIDTLQCMAVK